MHWFENYYAANSRPWLVVDPADGKVPPQTAEAQQRARARQQARAGRGPADSWEDRSNYDRCITRGHSRLDDARRSTATRTGFTRAPAS